LLGLPNNESTQRNLDQHKEFGMKRMSEEQADTPPDPPLALRPSSTQKQNESTTKDNLDHKELVMKRMANVDNIPKGHDLVFLQFEVDGKDIGIIELELFSADCPKTCENFRSLCQGFKTKNESLLIYKGSTLHRIIPNFVLQGGDITKGNGAGGASIYGTNFDDENFKYKHDAFGNLCMANSGKNSNRSQFYITFTACPWLDGKDVVFGKVFYGADTVKTIESFGTSNGTPKGKIVIKNCGISIVPLKWEFARLLFIDQNSTSDNTSPFSKLPLEILKLIISMCKQPIYIQNQLLGTN